MPAKGARFMKPSFFYLHPSLPASTEYLEKMVQGFGLSAHVFADDLQVYCHFLDGKEQVALQLFRDCSESVSRWMSSNRLKLNPLKTELIWLHSSRRNLTFLRKDIVLFGSPITPVNVVRNLGVILDENMTMSEHIARVCRNCYYQLRQIRRIKRSLTA